MHKEKSLIIVLIFLISIFSHSVSNYTKLHETNNDSRFYTSNNTQNNLIGYQEGSIYSPQTAIFFGDGSSCQIIEAEVWCQRVDDPGQDYWSGIMVGNYSLSDNWPDKYHPLFPQAPLDDLNQSYNIDFLPENKTPNSIFHSPSYYNLNSICVVFNDGSLTCWQQHGNWITEAQQDLDNYSFPTISLPNSQKISTLSIGGDSGNEFACAITDADSNNVYCFTIWDHNGNFFDGNQYGELGLGFINNSGEINSTLTNHTFSAVDLGGRKATSISAGLRHVCAVTETTVIRNYVGPSGQPGENGKDVEVMCWGDNTQGQLGNGTRSPQSFDYNGNTSDPDFYSPNPIPITSSFLSGGLNTPIAVEVIEFMSCALLLNGDVSCWGGDENTSSTLDYAVYQVTLNNPFTNIHGDQTIGLYVGTTDVCVLSSNGFVNCWKREIDWYDSGSSQAWGSMNATHSLMVDLNVSGVKPVSIQENGNAWGDYATMRGSICSIMSNGSYSCFERPTLSGASWGVGPFAYLLDANGTVENRRLIANKSVVFSNLDGDSDNIQDSVDFCRSIIASVYGCHDYDSDGIPNPIDVFPLNSTEWIDTDGDGIGDNTDTDDDNDGMPDLYELQSGYDPLNPNMTPPDFDGDGIPDFLDIDDDNDGLIDTLEGYAWTDSDNDGMPNQRDTDSDNDGVLDGVDTCHSNYGQGWISNLTNDYDSDGCDDYEWDKDDDNDGICDVDGPSSYGSYLPTPSSCLKSRQSWNNTPPDPFGTFVDECVNGELGWISNTTTDYDADGCKDFSEDTNDDNDPYEDVNDNCSLGEIGWSYDPNFYGGGYSNDYDTDGCHDGYEDEDWDNDGISNSYENIYGTDSRNASDFPSDIDGDGIPDAYDGDKDGDGYYDGDDAFPRDEDEWFDTDGDGIGNNADLDDDDDGILDLDDALPTDASQWNDTDNDGFGDNPAPAKNPDSCLLVFGLSTQDRFGCPDSDGDGWSDPDDVWTVADGADAFVDNAAEWRDGDVDGIGDNSDNCPDAFNPSQLDSDYWIGHPSFRDGKGDACDDDDDNDGVLDSDDDFKFDQCAHLDTDSDGMPDFIVSECIPNNSSWIVTDLIVDNDDDNDGISDIVEEGGLFTNENCDWQWYVEGTSDEFGGHVWSNTFETEIRHRQPVTYFPEYLMPGSQWGPRSITTCDFSYDAFNDSDGDKKTLGNYFTEGDPGQWNQFGDADECVVGHDVMLNSRYTNSPAGYADRWDRMHRYCSNPLDPKSNDTDGDGISDWDEIHQIQRCTPQEHLITFKMVRWGDEYIPERGSICHTNPLVVDTDGDGFDDLDDAFPTDPSQWLDSDGDGFGDNPVGYRPDSCLEIYGNSTADRWGCPDTDGDGYSNTDENAPAHPNGTADAFPFDPTQWEDSDGDGYGDEPDRTFWDGSQYITLEGGDLWPNDPFRWYDTDLDGIDNNSDACPEETGSSTIDRVGCPDSDGDGVSDRYDTAPDDPQISFVSEFIHYTVATKNEFYASNPNDCQAYGGSEFSVDYNNDILAVVYYDYQSYSHKTVIERYDRTTNTWNKLVLPGEIRNDCRADPSHIELIVDEKGMIHFLLKESSGKPKLKYHQWDGTDLFTHQFRHWELGSSLAVDGNHIHITRTIIHDNGEYSYGLNYEYSSDGGKTWTEEWVKKGVFIGTAVAASGSTGYFVYSSVEAEKYCSKKDGTYTLHEGTSYEVTYDKCVQYSWRADTGSGIYYMTKTNSGFSPAKLITNSDQKHVFKNPKIALDRTNGHLIVLAGGVKIIGKSCHPSTCLDFYPDGLYAFAASTASAGMGAGHWHSEKIADGHAGSSYDLDMTDAGVPHAVFKSTLKTVRYVYLTDASVYAHGAKYEFEWETYHVAGDIKSGVGLALYDKSPIFIHTFGDKIYLTSWDDDNDGLGNWEDYCPYAFGLSTDETQGCPDTDADGKTDQIEGTEDEDDSGGFGLPSLSFAGTLWMIVGVAILIQRKNNDED